MREGRRTGVSPQTSPSAIAPTEPSPGALRVAARPVPLWRRLLRATSALLGGWLRPQFLLLRQMLLQGLGLFFLVLSILFAVHGLIDWHHLHAVGRDSSWPALHSNLFKIEWGFALLFAYFGLTSFWRALQGGNSSGS